MSPVFRKEMGDGEDLCSVTGGEYILQRGDRTLKDSGATLIFDLRLSVHPWLNLLIFASHRLLLPSDGGMLLTR
jgi:hypothetical protein